MLSFKKDFKFTDEPYMNKAEQMQFEILKKNGVINIFRIKNCKNCKKDIPNIKIFCSLECFEKLKFEYEVEEEKRNFTKGRKKKNDS